MAKEKAVAGKKTVKPPASRPSTANAGRPSRKPSAPGRITKTPGPPKKPAVVKTAPSKPVPVARPKSPAKPAPKPTAKPATKVVGKVTPAVKPSAKPAVKPVAPPVAKASAPQGQAAPKTPKQGTAPKDAKPATAPKPVARPIRTTPVAGVLQAARSVASRANKVVEVQAARRSHLTAEELSEFKQVLLDKRRELVEDMVNLDGEAKRTGSESGAASSTMPIHMADLGSDTWEQEFTLNLIEKERAIVREIDEALDRIESKTYGTCLATGKPISKARLRVKPWAKHCIEYARKRELGLN